MRKGSACFYGAGLRSTGLGCAVSLLLAGGGCQRQTFDLLDPGPLSAGGSGGAAAGVGLASSGASSNGGSADAGARGPLGGSGTGPNPGSGGVTSEAPCLPGKPCTDGGLVCPATDPLCSGCKTSTDCSGDAPVCDTEDGRCGQCRVHGTDCPTDEICHPVTLRCVQACTSNDDCLSARGRPLCDQFGGCVSCSTSSDCRTLYGHSGDVCFFNSCVECYSDQQCALDKYCVGLHCQSKH